MTRVLFISSHAQRGGSERYLSGLLDELPRESVAGIVSLQDGPLVAALAGRGHVVSVLPTSARIPAIVRTALGLRRLARRARPDVIHANGIKAALVATLAGVGLRMPIVWVKHDYSWDGWLTRLIARRCGQVVGVSSAVLQELTGRVPVPLHVVPPGISDSPVDRTEARRALLALAGQEVDDGVAIVSLFGRLDPAKGHRELLEAAALIVEKTPQARFVFVGPEDPNFPTERIRIERRAAELGLERRVTVAGHRRDAVELIAASDVVVIPSVSPNDGSETEGASFVAIEALAVETPVVAYATGGVPEMLGGCGILIPPRDRTALAEAIIGVLQDPRRRAELTRRGRAWFVAKHLRSRMAAGLTACYAKAVQR
jgi:glycosyltransferase involved in cell wall biosynthesis